MTPDPKDPQHPINVVETFERAVKWRWSPPFDISENDYHRQKGRLLKLLGVDYIQPPEVEIE